MCLFNSNKTDGSKILAYLRKLEPYGLLSNNLINIATINFCMCHSIISQVLHVGHSKSRFMAFKSCRFF